MPAEENKAALRRFYEEVFNRKNLDIVDELLAPDVVDHSFGGQGVEASKRVFAALHHAFPDLRCEVHDVIGEGELVAARVTFSGTNQGEFMGVPATGRHGVAAGVDFVRMEGGRQAEHWGGPDMLRLLQQLGVLPPSPTGGGR
jgi:steroid delta-isomerase-like uncharacterized protein